MVQSVYEWFQVGGEKPVYRRTFYGATDEIQDDMMYDFMTRMQTTGRAVGIFGIVFYIHLLNWCSNEILVLFIPCFTVK